MMNREELGERVARIRMKSGKSARQLGLELGKSSGYLVQVENGKCLPPLDFLQDFCDYFNIPLVVLLDPDFKYPERYKVITNELDKLNDE